MNTRFPNIVIIVVCGLMAAACSRPSHPSDPALLRAEALSDRHYDLAAECLDSIDRASLDAHNRHFYDFLSLKVADKAYVQHTSDSTILALIPYASRRNDAHYAETLYYGGRVYSDLGDFPTALQYFHQALDALPDNDATSLLRSNILSQTGRLLTDMRLYEEATPYLKAVIDIDHRLNDSINEVYALQLLCHNFLNAEKYDEADSIAHIALDRSKGLQHYHSAWSKVLIAAAKLKKNDIDSAVYYINNTPQKVDPLAYTTALAYCCKIYNRAGMADSAYRYAQEIIKSNDSSKNRLLAYHMLLMPQLRPLSGQSEIDDYFNKYSHFMEDYYNENDNRMIISQQSLYNYDLHDTLRDKAEKTAVTLRFLIIIALFFAMLFALIALFINNKMKSKVIALQQALELINELKQKISFEKAQENQQPSTPTVENLREKLVKEVLSLVKSNKNNLNLNEQLRLTDAYSRLQECIRQGQTLNNSNSTLLLELDKAVAATSPQFNQRINILTQGKISTPDYHTLLLIKCGCTNNEMASLLSKSFTTITSRREKLSLRMFDRKLGSQEFDELIRML